MSEQCGEDLRDLLVAIVGRTEAERRWAERRRAQHRLRRAFLRVVANTEPGSVPPVVFSAKNCPAAAGPAERNETEESR